MLYPLSYEGLRPISYLAGDTHKCPGVPSGAERGHQVHRRRFRRWSAHAPSTFRAHATRRARR
jgi:hypothetical protein